MPLRVCLIKTSKYDTKDVSLLKNGTVILPKDGNYPLVGLWLMPNNKTNGMLEDFVITLTNGDDVLMEEAELALSKIESKGLNLYTSVHRSKAMMHTYLAWQEEPGRPMGLAITANVLNADSESARTFLEWIKVVFGVID